VFAPAQAAAMLSEVPIVLVCEGLFTAMAPKLALSEIVCDVTDGVKVLPDGVLKINPEI
jgi:hypothetical protein